MSRKHISTYLLFCAGGGSIGWARAPPRFFEVWPYYHRSAVLNIVHFQLCRVFTTM